jgi:hypothetical protein
LFVDDEIFNHESFKRIVKGFMAEKKDTRLEVEYLYHGNDLIDELLVFNRDF